MQLDFLPVVLAEILDLAAFAKAAIPIVAVVVGGTVMVVLFYLQHREQRMLHETARLALEKGHPIPPELLDQLSGKNEVHLEVRKEPRNDLRVGLLLIALGAGLYVFLSAMDTPSLRYLGAIPGFIGAAFLLCGVVPALGPRGKHPAPGPSTKP